MDDVRKKSLRELLPKEEFEQIARRPNSSRRKTNSETPIESRKTFEALDGPVDGEYRREKHSSLLLWICLGIIVIVGGYYVSTIFAGATLTITPRQSVVKLDEQFEAGKAPAIGIEYSVIQLNDIEQVSVPASGQVKVESKAKGMVTISNNFSTATQKLLAGTRLEGAGGLIFRLDKAITVPGKGKNGSISANVTADAIGPSYNIAPGTFKIVGFKGSPKYDGFTVRSNTAMSGGASGMTSVIKDEDKARGVLEAQTKIKDRLVNKAQLQIPKNYIMYPDGEMLSYSETVSSISGSSTALVTVKGQMVALLFNVKNLSQYLATKQFTDESVEGIMISNPTVLTFKLANKEQFDINKTNTVRFNLSGDANFVWPLDTATLKNKLAGIKFRNRDTVFSATPNIYRATAVIRPFWVINFPSNPSKITIKQVSQTKP